MNKFGMVIGVAAVAAIAGCKDPDYKYANAPSSQNEVKSVDTSTQVTVTPDVKPVVEAPVVIEVKKCTCAPGTKHTSPCKCGAPDCMCIVETKPVAVNVEPECTIYVVQSGDYLAKISKRFNVTINSIKKLNPSIKKDIVRVGQKLKLPGKIDVPAVPVTTSSKKTTKNVAKPVADYSGATKEYVVKNGDTLGAIAYGNGITIRQLKKMNGLESDVLKVGQKIKIPAEKVAKKPAASNSSAKAKPEAKKSEVKNSPTAVTESVAASAATSTGNTAEAEASSAVPAADNAPAAEAPKTDALEPAAAAPAESVPNTINYTVKEGEDIMNISISWGVSAAEIRALNNLSETDELVPNQIIKLPADVQQ